MVVRRRIGPDGGPPYSDLLGHLVTVRTDALVVRRSDGTEVTVALADVHRIKPVPPAPIRPTRTAVLALEETAAAGWQAPDTARLGGWLLRAAGGFTGRANSVLPIDEPDRPFEAALDAVERWYADRGLPPRFQVPLPAHTELDATLERHGYTRTVGATYVLTASVADALAATGLALTGGDHPDPLAGVQLAAEPSPEWLARYHHRGAAAVPALARQIMVATPNVVFASYERDGQIIACARAVATDGWAGVTAVEVHPDHRRQGLARLVMAAVLRWAGAQGANQVYLQVETGNAGALALYDQLGFTRHHRYHYRTRPA